MKEYKFKNTWVYSGNKEDYDGYYMNCPDCRNQFWAYDRDNEPVYMKYCPICGKQRICDTVCKYYVEETYTSYRNGLPRIHTRGVCYGTPEKDPCDDCYGKKCKDYKPLEG